MKTIFFLIFLLSAPLSFAQVDAKKLATEMSAMTRSMNLLFARQEMKESLPTSFVGNFLRPTPSQMAGSDLDRKVALLTDTQSLANCQVKYNEIVSPDGSQQDAWVEYKGADCPILITAVAHIISSNSGADAKVDLQFEILSEQLKKELDLEKFNIQMKIKITAAPTEQGFAMNIDMSNIAKIQSQKLGLINYTAAFANEMVFGQSIRMKNIGTEVYSSGNQSIKFVQSTEAVNDSRKETYSVNDSPVSKEEFDSQHTNVAMPGFDDQKMPLAKKHLCEIKAYDSSVYSLEMVRKNIQDNTAERLKPTEVLPTTYLEMTGKTITSVQLSNQIIKINVAVTPDAARFNFEKDANGAHQPLGRLTAVLGEKVDLTKIILDRVVRITCAPQQ